nr:hypothetical protein [uncultured Mediterranean phage uvMED]
MSKNRKIADLLDDNGDVKLTNLDNIDLTNLNASNLTSGSIPDARVPSSAVSQHATSFDDNQIQTKLALLGFKTATVGSLATYQLKDQSIDEFTDNTGVNTSASSNASVVGGRVGGGQAPTVTHDADQTGVDGNHTWYSWTDTGSTGSYSQDTAQAVDFLVIAGGGPGGWADPSGGGGAGGLRTSYGSTSGGGASAEADLNLGANTSYTITVGAGGARPTQWSHHSGSVGGNSSITGSDITDVLSTGGGTGLGYHYSSVTTHAGGSGGGEGDPDGSMDNNLGLGTANQGYNGGRNGDTTGGDAQQAGGGGGGAGGLGGNGVSGPSGNGGTGGAGLNLDITGTTVGYAGGGGGGHIPQGSTASHGGGATGVAGTANTGGGGGGGGDSVSGPGAGGSGVVILRRLTNAAINNMTLVSNSVTAQSAPTKSDLILLLENGAGTATVNTDVKGYVSRDNGTTFTQGTLVDEGSYGTNTKIIAFHDLDISSQPTGTSMIYKVETLNQTAGSKETYIKAASLGWK